MVIEKWSGDDKKTIITTCPNTTNEEILLQQAETHYKEERLLEATRLLRQVQDPTRLTAFHQKWLHNAHIV
jgi:hypothetical protein